VKKACEVIWISVGIEDSSDLCPAQYTFVVNSQCCRYNAVQEFVFSNELQKGLIITMDSQPIEVSEELL